MSDETGLPPDRRGRFAKYAERAEDDIRRLRAALQPFADAFAEERLPWLYMDTQYDDWDVALLRYDDTGVTLGMLRAANAALEET